MSWLVFALATWVTLGLDVGLRELLRLGDSSVSPRFAMVLLVFVCLWARPGALMMAAILIGLLVDALPLMSERGAGATLVVLGPSALGAMVAAYTILTIRSVMQRKSPFTLAALTLIATLLVEVIRVTLLTVRSFYDDIDLDGAIASLGTSAGIAAYTALLALLLAPLLNLLRRPMRFEGTTGMGFVIHS